MPIYNFFNTLVYSSLDVKETICKYAETLDEEDLCGVQFLERIKSFEDWSEVISYKTDKDFAIIGEIELIDTNHCKPKCLFSKCNKKPYECPRVKINLESEEG